MMAQLPQRPRSEHWHALCWLVIVAAATAAYVFAHYRLEPYYLKDIRPQLKDAVRMYGLRRDKRTDVLELYVDTKAYDPDAAPAGPLGIGQLPEARGVLHSASEVVEEHNLGVRKYVDGLRSRFFRSPHNPHLMAMIARPPTVQPNGQYAQYRFRVPADSFAYIRQEYPNEKTLIELIDLVAAAEPVRVIEGAGLRPWPEGKGDLTQFVTEVCQRRQELRAGVAALFGPSGSVLEVGCVSTGRACGVCGALAPLSPGEPSDSNGKETARGGSDLDRTVPPAPPPAEREGNAGNKLAEDGSDVVSDFSQDSQEKADAPGSADSEAGPPNTDSTNQCPDEANAKPCAAQEESKFHKNLRLVVESNAGFFWTGGRFFWLEIMALAALGVLVRQLVLFARAYTGRRGAKLVWRPRESLRTLMYLAVAPIFSLVIIWILTATNLVAVRPSIGDDWAKATVPIAFFLGLFPTLGYDVLRGLAEGLFGRPFKADDRDEARLQEIPAVSHEPTDAPPSAEWLRQRIRHHATAVFR